MMTAEDRQLRRLLTTHIVFINSHGQPVKRAVSHIGPMTALKQDRRRALDGCDAVVVLNELPYDDALTVYRRALRKVN